MIKTGVYYLDTADMNIAIEKKKWYQVNAHQVFEFIVNICVVISILILIVDNPLSNPYSYSHLVMRSVDMTVTLVFFAEAIIKIIALGFVKTSYKCQGINAYIFNIWNIIDFLVLFTTMVYIFEQ